MTPEMRRSEAIAIGLMAWWGYAAGVNGALTPLLATSLGVTESALASAFAWIGIASLGALALGRLADRVGRRRVVLVASALLPFGAAASARAESLTGYVLAQSLVYACGTSLLASLVVLAADGAPPARRARAQGRMGVAFLAGTALPLLACAMLAPQGAAQAERWRWIWWLAVLPASLWPVVVRWLRDAPVHPAPTNRHPSVTIRRARRTCMRAPALFGAATLIATAELAARSWLFFQAVAQLGLAPRRALAVIAAGGVASLAGFGAGARLADRRGRRIAFAASAALFAIGAVGYFAASLVFAGDPSWLLLASLATMGLGGNAATTAFRAHATELAPPHARGALAGSLAVANATGWIVSMFATSSLAGTLGSIGLAVTTLVAAAVSGAIALVLVLPETAGAGRGRGDAVLCELDAAA